MEKSRAGSLASNRCTRVDLPEPEGAEMMKTVVSLKIQSLLADLFDGSLGSQRQFCDPEPQIADSAGLRKDGIGFAVQLLQQEIEALAHFAARIQNFIQLAGVDLES